MLGCLKPNNGVATQSCPLAVCMKSSWAHRCPLNTPLHMILLTRGLTGKKWLHVWSFFFTFNRCLILATGLQLVTWIIVLFLVSKMFVLCVFPLALCLCKCCSLHYLYPASFIRWVVYHSTKCANRPPKKLLWLNILRKYITLIT